MDARQTGWVFAVALVWALLWVLLPIWSDAAPSTDNLEQLVWSQGFELGYHKHPPLPTWILIAAEQLFHPSLGLTYVLSIAGLLIGACFLWRLSAELLGRAAAFPAVLATGCIAFFSYRAHIFNHNTVLVPFVYASAWAFLRAVRTGRLRYWVLLGVVAAGGMLTKYQFAVILTTFGLIALSLRLYRRPRVVRGALLAAGTSLVLLGPHIGWLIANDFLPFRYASQMVLAHLGLADRVSVSGGFILQQLRDALAAAVMLLLAAALSWRDRASTDSKVAVFPQGAHERMWILMLGFAPLGLMLALGLCAGVRLENHWGTTALQFIVLPMLWWMRPRRMIPAGLAAVCMFFVVQAAEVAYDVAIEVKDRGVTLEGGRLQAFEPQALAQAVEDDWRRATSGPSSSPARIPLRYLVGSTAWGGFVSLHSPDHPQVLISGDPRASPWVSMRDLSACGAVYFEPIRPPAGAPIVGRGEYVSVDFSNAHRGQPLRIRWAIVAPDDRCHRQQGTS